VAELAEASQSVADFRAWRKSATSPRLTLAESQLALAAVASLCAGEKDTDALKILRGVLRRAKPTLLPRVG
jgi:hypothetical protein